MKADIITDCRAYGYGGVLLVVGLPGGEDDGYFRFGFTAEVRVGESFGGSGDEFVEASVNIGGIASHSLDDGYDRAEVYRTACDLGTILLGEVRATIKATPVPAKNAEAEMVRLRALRGLATEFTFGNFGEAAAFLKDQEKGV